MSIIIIYNVNDEYIRYKNNNDASTLISVIMLIGFATLGFRDNIDALLNKKKDK
jgi:hypothetical protein